LSSVDVEIEVEARPAEARAIMDALMPESTYAKEPFLIELAPGGVRLKIKGRSLGDARAFANSVLRLLRVARESIQAVD
jgi:tRNA threonylcarbamoyladenosine modification (KEOPS) complex  Pcc1 subunit